MELKDKNELYGVSDDSKTDFDFIGFTFNGRHSSDLGITRTSEGSRYSEDLLPTIEDKTVPVPGGDGVYYFGSYYRQKIFNISIAFDKLTEKQFRQLKSHFGDKQLGDLIFDEAPYKVYKVKVSGAPNLKYICFDEYEYKTNTGTGTGTGTEDVVEIKKRVYKGEGTIQFVAFSPFARSRYKTLKDFVDADFPNKSEWAESSGMPEDFDFTPQPKNATDNNGKSYIQGYELPYCNPGDMETDFTIKINFQEERKSEEEIIYIINISKIELYSIINTAGTADRSEELVFSAPIESKMNSYGTYDDAILIDSKLNIIQGLKGKELTGNIYNEYITNGTFFKLPQFYPDPSLKTPYIKVSSLLNTTCPEPTLKFDYLYY